MGQVLVENQVRYKETCDVWLDSLVELYLLNDTRTHWSLQVLNHTKSDKQVCL